MSMPLRPVLEPTALDGRLDALLNGLRHREVVGSFSTAHRILIFLKEFISLAKFPSFSQLALLLRQLALFLQQSSLNELVIQNVFGRLILVINEEYANALDTHLSTTSSSTRSCPPSNPEIKAGLDQHYLKPGFKEMEQSFSSNAESLRPIFLEAAQELCDEVETSRESIAAHAHELIYSGETIMTIDHSQVVEKFFKAAAIQSKRSFTVIVAETSPLMKGRSLARSLCTNISTVVIPDSSIYALMSRCSKIVISCHIVFADGSILAKAGSLSLATAARACAIPVVVLCGMYKFSERLPGEEEKIRMRDDKGPDEIYRADESDEESVTGLVTVANPYYEHVPAHLISVLITNIGSYPPCLVQRLVKDMYSSSVSVQVENIIRKV